MENPEKTWDLVLRAALVAHNRSINSTMRDAPNDVKEEPILQFLQISDNAKKYRHNHQLAAKRVARVRQEGAFRRPVKPRAFGRGFEAKWLPKEDLEEISQGTHIKGAGDERRIDVKSILPVSAWTDASAEHVPRPGGVDRQRRDKTRDVIELLEVYLDVRERKPLRNVGPWLRAHMGDGVYDATLRSVGRNLAGVIQLWPQRFRLEERGNYFVRRVR